MSTLSAIDVSSYLGLGAVTLLAGVLLAGWWRIRHRWVRHVTSVAERGGGGRSTG